MYTKKVRIFTHVFEGGMHFSYSYKFWFYNCDRTLQRRKYGEVFRKVFVQGSLLCSWYFRRDIRLLCERNLDSIKDEFYSGIHTVLNFKSPGWYLNFLHMVYEKHYLNRKR
jgi:hypothetical protein